MSTDPRWYTVELVFWNPVTATVQVRANSVQEACDKALDEVDWDCSETCYDACTDTKVGRVAAGRHYNAFDAPAGAQRVVPKPLRDSMWSGEDA